MAQAQRSCWIETDEGSPVLHLGGSWRLTGLRELSGQLSQLIPAKPVAARGALPTVVDGSALQHIDTAAALLVLNALDQAGADVAALTLRGF
ncbi:MAG TPA: hypothetical protein VET87_18665, partial [Rubrivivax sp.]|nr:hypothetical protein [Rubrivivax sp.]